MATNGSALLIADVQNDFYAGGTLQVENGDRIIPAINLAAARFASDGCPVFVSRDWHPRGTSHFAEFGGPWPVHCVQGTSGAAFHPGLNLPECATILSKGIEIDTDGYSAFEAVTDTGENLRDALKRLKVHHLYLSGLTTEYCIMYTAMDAISSGFSVSVLTDAVAGINTHPGDCSRALEIMVCGGVQLVTSDMV